MFNLLDRKATLMVLSGTMGAGKSATAVKYVCDNWLPYHQGPVICNLPLHVDEIVKRVKARHPKMSEDLIRDRIIIIPNEWVVRMIDGEAGFADWLEHFMRGECEMWGCDYDNPDTWEAVGYVSPLNKALIILDEAQKFWPSSHGDGKGQTQRFMEFCSTVRHEGARCILLTQHFDNIASKLRRLIAFRCVVGNSAHWMVPLVRVPYDRVLQVIAKFVTGKYSPWVTVETYSIDGSQEVFEERERFFMPSEVFSCYESRNKEKGPAGEEEKLEWERLSTFRFLRWLWACHWDAAAKVALILVFMFVGLWPGMVLPRIALWGFREVGAVLQESQKELLAERKADSAKSGKEPTKAVEVEEKGSVETVEAKSVLKRVEDPASNDVLLIDDRGLVFRTGERLEIGDVVPWVGSGKVVSIESVDWLRGYAILSNGDKLLLHRSERLPSVYEIRVGESQLSGSVPSAGASGAGSQEPGRESRSGAGGNVQR